MKGSLRRLALLLALLMLAPVVASGEALQDEKDAAAIEAFVDDVIATVNEMDAKAFATDEQADSLPSGLTEDAAQPAPKSRERTLSITGDTSTALNLGDRLWIAVGLVGVNAVEWRSSATNVAQARFDEETGLCKVTPVGAGTAKLTAQIVGGEEETWTVTLTVRNAYKPETLSFDDAMLYMKVGEELDVGALLRITPGDIEPQMLTWKLSNRSVAALDLSEGRVALVAKKVGKTKITVYGADKKVKAVVRVKIEAAASPATAK